MTCRRAWEPELLTLVYGDGDAELRAHVDGCADCAAELAVWRELDGLLQVGVAPVSEHPAPDALVAFADAPATLAPDARGAIERHLAGCRPCADELRGLAAFTPAAVAPEAVVAAVPGQPRLSPSSGASRLSAGEAAAAPGRRGLGAILWHPAFAYALVVLLLVPLLRGQMPKLSYETRAVDERRDAPLLPPAEAPRANGAVGAAPAPPALPRPAPPAGAPPAGARAGGASDQRRAAAGAEHDASAPAYALADRGAAGRTDRPQAAGDTSVAVAPPKEERAAAVVSPDELRAEAARAKAPEPPRAPGAEAVPAPASGAGAPGASAAAAPAPLLRLDLQPQKPTIFGAEVLGRPLQLRLFPPADLARGPLTVTIRGRANRQQLTTISTNDANAIAVALPADWLASGDYVVTLQPVKNGLEPAGQPALFGFTVSAPTAR